MNNQRHRRYKQAVDSNNVDIFMTDVLKITQGSLDFKANSISPGTEFMYELIQHMEFFIKRKLHEDENWRGLKVWFSPGSVPGEGEHKIMDYLRSWSQSEEYQPRDVHCIYGNDSDLVMLSLKLHLPNIIILRESNRYVDKDTVINYAAKRFTTEDAFEILYINLLREYLILEFATPAVEEAFSETHVRSDFKAVNNMPLFNAERFIDDFVFLSCFIGNDFLPQLYCLSTKMGHFDTLMDLLRAFYLKEKKFLVFREKILWVNVRSLLASFRHLEEQFIDGTLKMFSDELRRFDQKRKFLDQNEVEDLINQGSQVESMQIKKELQKMDLEEKDIFLFQYKKEYAKLARAKQRIQKMVDLRNNRTQRREFYYFNYFSDVTKRGYVEKTVKQVDNRIGQFCRNYFEGMRFKHLYYTIGCPTWLWYFKFENCPLITDMYHFLDELYQENLLSDLNFKVLKGKPFRPFVQLLHILPKQSLGLLPPLFEKKIFEKKDESESEEEQEIVEKSEETQEEVVLSKKEKFQKRCLIGTPLTEEEYIGFCFESDKLSEEELKEKKNIKKCQKFVKFFPKKFMVEASDNLKNYTWIPLINDIDRESMKKFILEFPWTELKEEEKRRNRKGKNKFFEYDESGEVEVVPCLPGFSKFKAKVKESHLNWEDLWGKNVRKLDKLYLKKEKMLGYTNFKLPSFINAFGGLEKIKLSLKIKYLREIAFLVCPNDLMMARMTKNPLISTLEVHGKISSGVAKIKVEDLERIRNRTKKNQEKKNQKNKNQFEKANLKIQNQLIRNEKKIQFLSDYQDRCIKFLKNKHDFQKFFYFDELSPKKMLFIRKEWLSGKQKDKSIKNMLKTLKDDFFIEVKNQGSLFKIKKLLQIYLGAPSFSVLEMKSHKPPKDSENLKSEISFDLQWKQEEIRSYPISMVFEAIGFNTIFQYKETLLPIPKEFNLSNNKFETVSGQKAVAIDLNTGNLISLGPKALELYDKIQNGERFEKIPKIQDYEVMETNHRGVENLKLNNLNDKMFALDSCLLLELGFTRKQKWIVWIILDSVLMFCDKQQSSSLVLGMKFDVGLNIMNLLNKKTYDFKTVSDLVKVYLKKNYDLSSQDGVQRLLKDFVYLKFLNMYLFFQEEGKFYMEMLSDKKKVKNLDSDKGKQKMKKNLEEEGSFLKEKYNEFCEMIKFIKGLVGKKTLAEWKKKVLKLRRQACNKRKDSVSLEISEIKAFFDIENEPQLLKEILCDKLGVSPSEFPDLRVEYNGFHNFLNNLKSGFYYDIEMFINCFPPDLYMSLEGWKVKTFSIYLSQRGLNALEKYIKDQTELVQGLKDFPSNFWKIEQSQNDGFVRLKVKSKFRVRDLFTQFYPQEEYVPKQVMISDGKGKLVQGTSLEPMVAKNPQEIGKKETQESGDQMDQEMTFNLKSMLGLKSEEKEESGDKQVQEKVEEEAESDSIFMQLASEFSEKVVVSSQLKPEKEPPKIKDANIKLFHCYANILKKDHSNLLLQPALSRHYSIDTIINKILSKSGKGKTKEQDPLPGIKVTNLITKSGNSSITWPPLLRKPPFHSLGDRVVHINPDNFDLKFGQIGTVIGIYKEKIEVLLDVAIIGADDLSGRVPAFRGKMLGFFDVFNLSKWRTLVFEEKHLQKVEKCWQGEYDYSGLISQIKKDSRHLKNKTYWNS